MVLCRYSTTYPTCVIVWLKEEAALCIARFPKNIFAKTMNRRFIDLSITVHNIECPKTLARCGVRWIRMNEVEIAEFDQHDLQVQVLLNSALNISSKGKRVRLSSIVKTQGLSQFTD